MFVGRFKGLGIKALGYISADVAVNIALDKPTSMSSTYASCYSSFAVDGNTAGYMNKSGGCAHTTPNDREPWWMVDLLDTYLIISINVTNRDHLRKYSELETCTIYWEIKKKFPTRTNPQDIVVSLTVLKVLIN